MVGQLKVGKRGSCEVLGKEDLPKHSMVSKIVLIFEMSISATGWQLEWAAEFSGLRE